MTKINRRDFVAIAGQVVAGVTALGTLSSCTSAEKTVATPMMKSKAVTPGPMPVDTASAKAQIARMQSWLLDTNCSPIKDDKLSQQIASVHTWARSAFLGEYVSPLTATSRMPLKVGAMRPSPDLNNRVGNPVVFRLPEPGAWLEAQVAVNGAEGAQAAGGIVVAAVVDREIYRSALLRTHEAPVHVKIDLKGGREFSLSVLPPGGVIPAADSAIWADAVVTLRNGQRMGLDQVQSIPGAAFYGPVPLDEVLGWLEKSPGISGCTELSAMAAPFSFVYDGRNVRDTMGTWKRQIEQHDEKNCTRYTLTFTDPATRLEVLCDLKLFKDFPAVEWVLHLTNHGSTDTPIIQHLLPLDLNLILPPVVGAVKLHHSHGSTAGAKDFLPIDQTVKYRQQIDLAPAGGRSSNGVLPFFNFQWPGGGMAGAIGWTGQWSMNLQTDIRWNSTLQAGQQTTHFKLLPGESIRTPGIVLLPWRGQSPLDGNNLFRRFVLEHVVPRIDGKLVVPPVSMSGDPVAIGKFSPDTEVFWLDAGWFKGGWPEGVGNWMPDRKLYPHGLKPIADIANQNGMQFLLWFEPERVGPGTQIATEYPQWVMHVPGEDGLFAMGNPKARQWMTHLLAHRIRQWGIGILRHDFNIDPLRFWQRADTPDRQGISEIRYIEGLYAMWDELIAQFPYLAIDCCASGGRRIDLESMRRCFYLWRSDTQCAANPHNTWDQVETGGLDLYVPMNTCGDGAPSTQHLEPYFFRSAATAGIDLGVPDSPAAIKLVHEAIAELKLLRPLYLGDYYPLAPINLDGSEWAAWQYNRPELGMGFAVFFRRPGSGYIEAEFALQHLMPHLRYEVIFKGETYRVSRVGMMTGEELSHHNIRIAKAPGSALIIYRRAKS